MLAEQATAPMVLPQVKPLLVHCVSTPAQPREAAKDGLLIVQMVDISATPQGFPAWTTVQLCPE
jgi:hypothetical protein